MGVKEPDAVEVPAQADEDGDNGWLGTAAKVAGLLAGAVAAVYVLGGLIVALRLLFEGFSASSVVTLLGQLPRELVISTALIEALGPAAIVGVTAALVFGAYDGPRDRREPDAGKTDEEADRLLSQPRRKTTIVFIGGISLAMMAPAFLAAGDASGLSQLLLFLAVFYAFLVTFALAAAGWYAVRRSARLHLSRLPAAALGGLIWAGMAVIPATMFAGGLEFERAQVCSDGSATPVEGLLVGETSDHLLLATDFEDEESVLSLPEDRVTKSEYGDLSSDFVCAASGATASLGDHGSDAERTLATKLRPWLRFDSDERWRPLEVDRFAAERFDDGHGHGACAPGEDPPCPDVADPDELNGEVAFLDIHGSRPRGVDFASASLDCARPPPPAVDCNGGEASIMYYRRSTHAGHWYWDYWWLLRYNNYNGRINRCAIVCGDHEGDWEGITVITTATADPEILGAIYATHKERILIGATSLPLVETHPLVFVARGTHAAYPFRCSSDCHQYSKLGGFRLPEESHDGAVLWENNREKECEAAECVRPLPQAALAAAADSPPVAGAWAAWGGLWGETCHNGCRGRRSGYESSPRSPGRQTRFECPWAATRIARPGVGEDARLNSEAAGDTKRLLALCEARLGGL